MSGDLERARRDRDYSGFLLDEFKWEDFCRDFTRNIGNMQRFQLHAVLSGVGRWHGLIDASRLSLSLHGAIVDALGIAKFANIPDLDTVIDDERLSFRYRDTDYAFDLDFQGDGTVRLSRPGSTMRTFHRWYTRLMPTVPGILKKAIDALDEELHRSLKGEQQGTIPRDQIERRVKLLTASFAFGLVCHNFRPHRLPDQRKRNLDVMMENMFIRIPDERGRVDGGNDGTGGAAFERFGRMDYRTSRRHPSQSGVYQVMQVEAPSNSGWSGLFFRFVYSGENYGEDAEGVRIPLDPNYFLKPDACADAYISFFREIGLEGFVSSVTKGYDFDTTSGSIA